MASVSSRIVARVVEAWDCSERSWRYSAVKEMYAQSRAVDALIRKAIESGECAQRELREALAAHAGYRQSVERAIYTKIAAAPAFAGKRDAPGRKSHRVARSIHREALKRGWFSTMLIPEFGAGVCVVEIRAEAKSTRLSPPGFIRSIEKLLIVNAEGIKEPREFKRWAAAMGKHEHGPRVVRCSSVAEALVIFECWGNALEKNRQKIPLEDKVLMLASRLGLNAFRSVPQVGRETPVVEVEKYGRRRRDLLLLLGRPKTREAFELREWAAAMRDCGWRVVRCLSLAEARKALKAHRYGSQGKA